MSSDRSLSTDPDRAFSTGLVGGGVAGAILTAMCMLPNRQQNNGDVSLPSVNEQQIAQASEWAKTHPEEIDRVIELLQIMKNGELKIAPQTPTADTEVQAVREAAPSIETQR